MFVENFLFQSMNFLAKHFFEYQSFTNLPQKAIQIHKMPVSQAGADPTAGWGPKSMLKAGKNYPSAYARANRNNVDSEAAAHRHGIPGKHKYREWGERHGELKPEKTTSHKDALTKFLSNDEPSRRTVFESDFEDRILQMEPETLPERLARTEEVDGSLPYVPQPDSGTDPEVLTILTYAPQVQFVTATVKKAKRLPFHNKPFAKIMLFEGRRLLEQKQTTVTPITACNSCVKTRSRSKPSSIDSPPSPSFMQTAKCNDAVFSESFLFRMTPEMLDRCHIVIQMYDTDPSESSSIPFAFGHCVIGPLSAGTGCAHWLQMIRKSGLPVCMWHRMIST
uniref:C2 domain-containing protein n=1 Tax=Syphacia muris TaxID=451379 RepID=A0A0N5A9T6_9BILA